MLMADTLGADRTQLAALLRARTHGGLTLATPCPRGAGRPARRIWLSPTVTPDPAA